MDQWVQKELRIPLYLQLAERLRRLILSATLRPGDPLPAERILCEDHGVSRATVREAINLLKQDGFIETRRGAGNFVTLPTKVDRDLLRIHDFNLQIEQHGQINKARILSYEPSFQSIEIARALKLASSSLILRVARLRLADDTPLFLETLYLPRERFSRENERTLVSTDLVLERFPQEYGIRIDEVVLEMEPILLNERQAELLHVSELPSAGLLNKRTSYDVEGVPALYAEWLFAGGTCRHMLRLKS